MGTRKTKSLKQVRFLLSKGSTLSKKQKNKLKTELKNKTIKITLTLRQKLTVGNLTTDTLFFGQFLILPSS